MDTIIIKKLLKKFKCFKGVYPLNFLPNNLKLPINLIANTHPSSKPGEHWISISINSEGKGQYFDSFGLPPLHQEFFDFLESYCKKGWDYNKVSLQHPSSNTCGHYCVLFIIFKCLGLTYENFISKFNTNSLRNDERMKKIFGNFLLAKTLK